MQLRSKRLLSLLLVSATAAVSLACSDAKTAEPKLSLIAPPVDRDAERARLRELQMVTVAVDDGTGTNLTRIEAADLAEKLRAQCAKDAVRATIKRPDETTEELICEDFSWNCQRQICDESINYCIGQSLLEMASLRASPYKIIDDRLSSVTTYLVPPQPEAVNTALAKEARNFAKQALVAGEEALWFSMSDVQCDLGIAMDDILKAKLLRRPTPDSNLVEVDATIGSYLGNTFTDSYQLFRDATLRAVDGMLAMADSQRNAATLDLQVARGIVGEDLSRVAAAHLLVGGDRGLNGSLDTLPRAGLCNVPQLTGQAQRAVDVLRQAGVAPDLILATSEFMPTEPGQWIDIDVLMDSEGLLQPVDGLPRFSVRESLERLWNIDFDGLSAGQRHVAQYFDLTNDDFSEARAYLANEILAFSRSRSYTWPAPGLNASGHKLYAGTSGPTPDRPAAYWSAVVRNINAGLDRTLENADDLATMADVFAGTASALLDASYSDNGLGGIPDLAIQADVVDPLAAFLTQAEGKGRLQVKWELQPGEQEEDPPLTAVTVLAHGLGATDGLMLVRGEDGLECAVHGSVEGAPCNDGTSIAMAPALILAKLNSAAPLEEVLPPFNMAAKGTGSASGQWAGTRLYLVRAKAAGAIAVPGAFEALVGYNVPILYALSGDDAVPIVPEVQQRAAEVIRPSRDWCSTSSVPCAGTSFDERLPLEDELSDDGNNVESSWKHYLELAKQAAREADALGEAYIQHSLDLDLSVESSEMSTEEREKAAEDRALLAVEELQGICGTAVEPMRLLRILRNGSNDPSVEFSKLRAADTCDPPADTCSGSYKCVLGRCVVDVEKLLKEDQYANDPELRRLAGCLSENNKLNYVHLGSKERPLCVWQTGSDVQSVCQGSTNAMPCPLMAVKVNGVFSCAPMAHPQGTTIVPVGQLDANGAPLAGTDTLDYIPTKDLGSIQSLRTTIGCPGVTKAKNQGQTGTAYQTGVGDVEGDIAAMRDANLFHPAKVESAVGRLAFEARFGSYAALLVDGKPAYHTGSIEAGPNNGAWPCAKHPEYDAMACSAADPNPPLFCDYAKPAALACSNLNERARLNNRLLESVLSAGRAGGRAHVEAILPARRHAELTFGVEDIRTFSVGGVSVGEGTPRMTRADGVSTLLPGKTYVVPAGTSLTSFLRQDPQGNWVDMVPPDQGPLFLKYEVLFESKPEPDYFFGGLSNSDSEAGVAARAMAGSRLVDWSGGASDPLFVLKVPSTGPVVYTSACASNNPPPDCDKVELCGNYPCPVPRDPIEPTCIVQQIQPQTVSCGQPPSAYADAHEYMQCLGQSLKVDAGRRLFVGFPAAALDPLRHASGVGSFPAVGGARGVDIAQLRAALIQLSDTPAFIGSQLEQMGLLLRNLDLELANLDLGQDANQIQLWKETADRITNCVTAVANTGGASTFWEPGRLVAAAATCVNSAAQVILSESLNDIQQQMTDNNKSIAINDFQVAFSDAVRAIQSHALQMQQATETIDGQLAQIELDGNRAKFALARLLGVEAAKSKRIAAIHSAMHRRLNTDKVRYERAFKTAQRMAFIAKRAIEMRLGLNLADLQEDLPLVEAPARWESTVCETTGVDYAELAKDTADDPTVPDIFPQNYADRFIGDYVAKLEQVVESYRLVNNFHEGSDTAVISLRDDVLRVKASCVAPVGNHLFHAGDLSAQRVYTTPGWERTRCPKDAAGKNVANCLKVLPVTDAAYNADSPELGAASAFELTFGNNAALVQALELDPGRYRFSWYQQAGAPVGVVEDLSGAGINHHSGVGSPTGPVGSYLRHFTYVDINVKQTVAFGFRRPTVGSVVRVAAPFVEAVRQPLKLDELSGSQPGAFTNTTDVRSRWFSGCEDTTGRAFRSTWRRGQARLCPDGFSGSCASDKAKLYTYWETKFNLSQRDIELGRSLPDVGFARGNFNYRVDGLALNVVGTGIRDCSDLENPTTCEGSAFVPYSLQHDGPYLVRNHAGSDFKAYLFPGKIENARGLAAERYITNPISTTDRELLTAYTRAELRGRPLDGNFTLRVWDVAGFDFEKIRDVQVVLTYRYWTRFE